jgi:predicted ArsR family transcriptional regulator
MTIQDQARALGDPTRFRLFTYVAEVGRPVTIAELTDQVRQKHNAVRAHLSKLVDAGLLIEQPEQRQRAGRPRLLYSLAPGALGVWDTDGPYRELTLLLFEVLRTGEDPETVGRRVGAAGGAVAATSAAPSGATDGAVAAEVAQADAAVTSSGGAAGTDAGGDDVARAEPEPVPAAPDRPTGVRMLVGELARRGFDPKVVDEGAGHWDVVLRTCPYQPTAPNDPGVVCVMHEGIARGIADTVGDIEVEGLEINDPAELACRFRVVRRPGTSPVDLPA